MKIMMRQMWRQDALVVLQLQQLKPFCDSCHKYQFVEHGFRLNMNVTAEFFSWYIFKCHNFQFVKHRFRLNMNVTAE